MVGAAGFELATLCSQSRCATRLRYAPTARILTCFSTGSGFKGRFLNFSKLASTRKPVQSFRDEALKELKNYSLKYLPKNLRSAGTACGALVTACQVTEGDAALGQVVGRHLQRNLVARQDADVVLAHLATRVSNQLVPIVQGYAKARVWQNSVREPCISMSSSLAMCFYLVISKTNFVRAPGTQDVCLAVPRW